LLGKSSMPSCHFCISTAQDSYNVTFISILHLRFNILDYSIYFENNTKQHFWRKYYYDESFGPWPHLAIIFFMKLKDGGPHQMKCLYRCTYPLYCSVGVYFLFWGSKARDARIKKRSYCRNPIQFFTKAMMTSNTPISTRVHFFMVPVAFHFYGIIVIVFHIHSLYDWCLLVTYSTILAYWKASAST
jgi:hypothetical protein